MLLKCCVLCLNSPLCVCVYVCVYSHACKAACCMAPMLQSYRDNRTPYVGCLVQYKAVMGSLSEIFFTIVLPKKLFPVGIPNLFCVCCFKLAMLACNPVTQWMYNVYCLFVNIFFCGVLIKENVTKAQIRGCGLPIIVNMLYLERFLYKYNSCQKIKIRF